MASQSIPSSRALQQSDVNELTDKAQSSLKSKLELTGLYSRLKQIEFPKGTHERLIQSPMMELVKVAEARFGSPDSMLCNSDTFAEFASEGFLKILTSIVKEAELFPLNEIAECGVEEAVFTHALDRRPIVATDSLATCVGMAGYERENRFGFVIHFTVEDALEASKEMLLEKIKQMSKDSHPIEIHLRGGIAGHSEPLVAAIEEWVRSSSELGCQMIIVSKEVLTEGLLNASGTPNTMSISLDTRDGTINTYDSSTNPYAATRPQVNSAKEADDLFDKLFMKVISEKPEIKIVYSASPI